VINVRRRKRKNESNLYGHDPAPLQLPPSDPPDPGPNGRLGRVDDDPEGWKKWRYCFTLDGGMEGWVPEQIIQTNGTEGMITEDYSAP